MSPMELGNTFGWCICDNDDDEGFDRFLVDAPVFKSSEPLVDAPVVPWYLVPIVRSLWNTSYVVVSLVS